LASAKILPFAYAGFSGALLYKATKATTQAESIVLLAVSALSFLNFSASDNAKLKSAKLAYQSKTKPASAGKEKQLRQAALTWRKAVRVKIIGQFLGLARMVIAKESVGVMRGAAILMASSMMYFITGAGRSNHDHDGNWKPLSDKTVTRVLTMNAILCGAALVAASASLDSTKLNVAARIYAAGAIVGSLEGIPQFIKAIIKK